mgnify:CR=1 FL=1|tara:strand:+ start:2404 stop:3354 length:951 start_codon:yes stop_codon:yes gene_type:complete
MNDIKFFIGPMSKNVVDAVIEFTEENGNKVGFIPSRRQVEYNGGYVNNWTTNEFAEYVNGRVVIERDHGGPGQGYYSDGGYESFKFDSKRFDIIHVDPWKLFSNYNNGLNQTIHYMKYIHKINSNILFEVGTEEAVRSFTPKELDKLLKSLSDFNFFDNIKYAVVQSGVGLDLGKRINTGTFDGGRLKEFVDVCKNWNVLSKEHNGDYLTNEDIKVRFDIGLDSLNIAPEFGQLETLCYLEHMGDDIEDYYQICYQSNRWKKWVDNDFVPENNKKELIKICGHYVLSDKKFLSIKPDIDDKIKNTIKNKLEDLPID